MGRSTQAQLCYRWQSLAAPQWMNAGLGQQLVAGMQLKLEHSANISMAKLMAEVQA